MIERRTILIVEDSPSLLMTYAGYLAPLSHRVLQASDGRTAYEILRAEPVDCMLLDLNLPDVDGLAILKEVQTWRAPPAIIVITASASLSTAVNTVRNGAFDYLVKPLAAARLVTTVEIALSSVELRREVDTLRETIESPAFAGFIGRSLPMQAVYRIIAAAARSKASVFITGESGTGKELAAEALHAMSPRSGRAFVPVNCGAIPRDLMESMIFGHVKGAFTGATTDLQGAAEMADGGTLFLDELGDMDFSLQTKLLRFIQSGSYQRVGDSRVRQADIRFIAATNRDPAEAVRSGRLREDLFYRLHVVPIKLPPLRERGEDILLIARKFLAEFAELEGKRLRRFDADVEAYLLAFGWPGNVRQLQNVIRNVVILNDGDVVGLEMLDGIQPSSDEPFDEAFITNEAASTSIEVEMPRRLDQIRPLAQVERDYIEGVLGLCNGNLQLAARKLKLSPSTLYRKRESWTQTDGAHQPTSGDDGP